MKRRSIRKKSTYSLAACPATLSAKQGSAVCGLWCAVCSRRRQAAGFTLLEMLVVVAILMLFAGLILAGVNVARNRAKVLHARRDIAQLKTAWSTYYADYNAFPAITDNSIENGVYVTGEDVLQILRGRENHNNQNPKKISYMDFHQNTTYFHDPWGKNYRIVLDDDYDGQVDIPGGTLRQSVAAWSAGPDGTDGTDDDVRTWRE